MDVRREDDANAWRVLLSGTPGATFFHTLEWGRLIADVFGWNVHPLVLSDTADTAVSLVFEKGCRLEAGPIGYGGALAVATVAGRRVPDDWMEGVEECLGGRLMRVVQSPLGPIVGLAGGLEETIASTSIVRPAATFAETNAAVFTRSVRGSIDSAKRAGVSVDNVTNPQEIDELWPIYVHTMERVGAHYRTPPSLLRQLTRLGPEHVWVLKASHQDVVLAWSLFLRLRGHLFHWIAAQTDNGRRQRAGHALLAAMFERAAAQAVTTIDLGASKTDGQRWAKSRWGADELSYVVHRDAPPSDGT
jgi:hypothetical protein